LTPEETPVQWARVAAGLGTAYAERLRGDRADNLKHAIATYERAVAKIDRILGSEHLDLCASAQ
jgi:hypothetical protein